MTTSIATRPQRADLALNLGILAITLPFLPIGPFAWAVARRDLRAIRAGSVDPAGPSEIGTLQAARILGLAGSLLTLGALMALALLAVAIWATWAIWLAARAIF